MSDPLGPNSTDSFVNQNWSVDLSSEDAVFNNFSRMDLEFYLYDN